MCCWYIAGMFSRPFGKSDPRLAIALEECEPLVHFALVCGAKSCPPIKTYSAEVDLNQSGYRIDMRPWAIFIKAVLMYDY